MVKMMSSIKEESLTSPNEVGELTFNHPDFHSPSPPSLSPTSPPSPFIPSIALTNNATPTALSGASIQLPNAVRQRLDQRSLAQQALLNRAIRSRRHTLANVLRPW